MATDMAANSDSTLMNSHGARLPDFTLRLSASTMWVWGEIGYAQITSGLHRATASATPTDPSIWATRSPPVPALAGLALRAVANCPPSLSHGGLMPSSASSAAT